MLFDSGRRRDVWDDATGTMSHYRDRAHDLYGQGRQRGAGIYGHGRDLAENAYDKSRRRGADIYGESRRRVGGAVDALAGRRTSRPAAAPIATAATLGVVAGAALVAGAIWLLLRRRPAQDGMANEPARHPADEQFAGDAAATSYAPSPTGGRGASGE